MRFVKLARSLARSLAIAAALCAPFAVAQDDDQAAPPLPIWQVDDGRAEESAPDGAIWNDTPMGDGQGQGDDVVTCGLAPEEATHEWADVGSGVVAVRNAAADSRDQVWLMATARVGVRVHHWRQGPLALVGEATEVEVRVPLEVFGDLHEGPHVGTLSVRVVVRDALGRVRGIEALPPAVWTTRGGEVEALVRDWDWERRLSDGEDLLANADL